MHQLGLAADAPDAHAVRLGKDGRVALEFFQQGNILQRGTDAAVGIQQVALEQPGRLR